MKEANLGKNFKYPFQALRKHFIALGASGSGKTVLCKALVEEAALAGISSIVVDPQGDLASLAIPGNKREVYDHGIKPSLIEEYSKTKVVIFTPTSSKGIPICINPLQLPDKSIDKEDLVNLLRQVSWSICSLAGFKIDSDAGKSAHAVIYLLLKYCWENDIKLSTFDKLADMINNMPNKVKHDVVNFTRSRREIEIISTKIRLLTTAGKELLFQFGVPLDINMLLGDGKTQISVIYLNSLKTSEGKHFFVSMLATKLYQWMLEHPSKELQALFYLDEIAEYIPAGAKKPITKEILNLIFKQARKYGVGCVLSTQNPGDIDYKALAQFGTWSVGRLMTEQDAGKISHVLRSLSEDSVDDVLTELPKLSTGKFFVFAPDVSIKYQELNVRWLLSDHRTLTESDVKRYTPDSIRESFEPLMVKPQTEDNIEIEKEKEAITTTQIDKTKKNYFKLAISTKELDNIIEKNKKKRYVLFGPQDEEVVSSELHFKPFMKATVRVTKSSVFTGTNTEEYDLFFDAENADIVRFSKESHKVYPGFSKVIGLKETELDALAYLAKKNKELTSDNVAESLKISDTSARRTINSLLQKKLIKCTGRFEKSNLWKNAVQLNIPRKINKVASSNLSFDTEQQQGKHLSVKVDTKDVDTLVEYWFEGASAIDSAVIYYPIYEVTLSDTKKRRVIKISGITGRLLE